MDKAKILIVDDEADIIDFLEYNFKKQGFEVKSAIDGKKAIKLAKSFIPDLILMDVMMPNLGGIEACKQIREIKSLDNSIIVFLSARTEEFSELAAFEAGANGYITKPIKPKLLIDKVKGYLRIVNTKEPQKQDKIISKGKFTINKKLFTVSYKDELFSLTKKEFQLFDLFFSEPEKVYTREEIMDHVWGSSVVVGDRTIDVHIRKLREKFGKSRFVTLKGIGYKLSSLD